MLIYLLKENLKPTVKSSFELAALQNVIRSFILFIMKQQKMYELDYCSTADIQTNILI